MKINLNFIEAFLANGYKWCFPDGSVVKIYLSSSSSTPKCLICIVTIARTEVAKYEKVMVAELLVYLLGAYARNPAGWLLCLCSSCIQWLSSPRFMEALAPHLLRGYKQILDLQGVLSASCYKIAS